MAANWSNNKTTNRTIVVVDGDIMLCCRSGCWNHLVASLEWAVKWKNWLRSSAGYCTHTLTVICKHWQTRLPYAQKQTCRWGGVNFSWTSSTECANMLFLIYLTPYVTTREQRRALLWLNCSIVLMKTQVLSVSLIWCFSLKDTYLRKPKCIGVCLCVCVHS